MIKRSELIIIDNNDVSNKIESYIYDKKNNLYKIKNKKNKVYDYSPNRVQIVFGSRMKIENVQFFYKKKLMENIKEAYVFNIKDKKYYRLYDKNDKDILFDNTTIECVIKNYVSILKYMMEIASITSITTSDDKKLLSEQMKKINISHTDYALANYLKISNDITKEEANDLLIFPFGCNSSQYLAVKNAVYNKVSVIEGPPGTGKTQTILNIIANLLIRGLNCQVASNNNTAIMNIEEKLQKYNMDFFEALLGKTENKQHFVLNPKIDIPIFEEVNDVNLKDIYQKIKENNKLVLELYNIKKETANLIQKKSEFELEYKYFTNLLELQGIKLINIIRINYKKINLLINELNNLERITFIKKLKYIFIYKIGTFKTYKQTNLTIIKSLENKLYKNKIDEISQNIKINEEFIKEKKEIEEEFINNSMLYLKKYLSTKFVNKRKKYSQKEIWNKSAEFIKDYPVILSTTYSSRNTFNGNFKFDYIIMDEASQIDVVTGTLALSSAKNAVIIGDEQQLQNVVTNEIKKETDSVFKKYNIDKGYLYSCNSFLSSIKKIIPNVKNTLLVEHYRCHPKIINFCNQEFYNNELVIMTNDNNEKDVITIIRTNKGNHEREKTSQRQLDIILDIIKDKNSDDIGIIAPYNNQVELIKNNIPGVEVSTIHKFQGREKDVIIISTVDDKISDFVSNSNILNVAISRAKKQLYFIITGNEIENGNIKDLINYSEYYNMTTINSQIYSVFDLLYKQYEKERLEFYNTHNRISRYDSENIAYNLIKKILNDYQKLSFIFRQPLNDLIIDKSLLTEEEKVYASNHCTHIDFYIYTKIGRKPVLAVEIDGYSTHKKDSKQYQRDFIKNSILKKYNIPLLRLKTNESMEENRIREMLDKFYI